MSKVEATFVLKGEDEFSPVVDKAKSKMGMLQNIIGSGAVSSALKVAGLAGGWSSVYAKMLEASYEAKRFTVQSERLSIPVAQVAKLSRYAESSGINLSTMGRGMMMLQKFAGEALESSASKSGKLASNLGLTSNMLREIQKGGVDSFAEIKNALDQTVPEAEQTAIWIEIIGQRAFELGNFLKETPEKMREAGKESSAMSRETIEALVKGQKAYANFQQDISILAGESAVAFGPVLAILGAILRIILMLVAALTMVIPNAIRAMFNVIQNAWMRTRSVLPSWLGGVSDEEKEDFIKKNQKDIDSALTAAKSGLRFIEHNATEAFRPFMPDEEKRSNEVSSVYDPNDSRTLTQKVQYENYLKEKEEKARGSDDDVKAAKTDGDRLRSLERLVHRLKFDEVIMRATYGRSVMMTKEYLELIEKTKQAEDELAKARYENYKKNIDYLKSVRDEQSKFTLEMMRLSGLFKDQDIYRFELNTKMEELAAKRRQVRAQEEEFKAGRISLNDVDYLGQRKMENEIIAFIASKAAEGQGDGSAAKGDSMQRIGGGGQYGISVDDIPKKSLRNLEAIRMLLQRMAEGGQKFSPKQVSEIIRDIT